MSLSSIQIGARVTGLFLSVMSGVSLHGYSTFYLTHSPTGGCVVVWVFLVSRYYKQNPYEHHIQVLVLIKVFTPPE